MTDQLQFPETPYAGSSGWSGTNTSRERADRDDANGITSERQQRTLTLLRFAGYDGLTWKELSNLTHWHHGQASGVLSVLHKTDRIARLLESRDRCRVYVLNDATDGRETDQQGRKPHRCPNCGHEYTEGA